jgi:hypothetical protein
MVNVPEWPSYSLNEGDSMHSEDETLRIIINARLCSEHNYKCT